MPVGPGVELVGPDHAPDRLPEGEARVPHRIGPGVQTGEGQQVLHDPGHAVRLADDDVQEVPREAGGQVVPGLPQGLRVGADVGQGRAQLVGHVGHELFAPLLVAPPLRHVVQDRQDAPGPFVEGGDQQFQGPLPYHQLPPYTVRPLEGQHVPEGGHLAEELLVPLTGAQLPLEHLPGGGVPVDRAAVQTEGHHAVGHMEEEGVQLVALVLHGGQGLPQDPGHVVERARQGADLVGGSHGQGLAELPGGHAFGPGGELFDGAGDGLGEQGAQQDGGHQSHSHSLEDDAEELEAQPPHGLLGIQDVDDEGPLPAEEGDGGVHVSGAETALVAHGGGVAPDHGGPGGQEVGALFPWEAVLSGGSGEIGPGAAIQKEPVPAQIVDPQGTGAGLQHLPQELLGIVLPGGAAQIGDELPLIRAEDAVELAVEVVDIEPGDAGGQERAHDPHQGQDQHQHDERQFRMQTAEHGASPVVQSCLRASAGSPIFSRRP